ncbi:uroporphyrinogen-III C-methyltransferase [Microbulbifer aggregans]|uniref:uroporphyrinogen-III C-methyltransferase n=1 Tax=Microbulbifer aggregans TaxID=1769779 RepID=UPI001CFF2864|nr:uroporphyrinogen-III C-methyltransferase [Microbulbifer aggregans]
MSDKKAPPTASDKAAEESKDIPIVTEKATPKSNFAKADQEKQGGKPAGKGDNKNPPPKKSSDKSAAKATPNKGHGWLWFWLFLLLLIAAAVAAWYLIPSVRMQVGQHLQGLPLVGKHFATAQAPGGTSAGTASETANTETSGENTAATPSTTTPDTSEPAADTGTDSSQSYGDTVTTPSEPQQPAWQPQGTSPKPPTPVAPPTPDQTAALREQLEQQSQTINQLQQQIATMQRSVTAQGNRLSQLGNASREDWQLAEADYLLRLANQRLMLEQDSRAALGLVQEVDKIVRDVDLPDLYGVRQQLARDLTALKLVENVDREGLYLRLRALEEQLVKLNIQPKFDLATADTAEAEQQPAAGEASGNRFQDSWNNFKTFLKGSVRIRDAEIDPVLLSPQSETRFRQTLRLSMEQAELALLRADATVYTDALKQARELLIEYGVDNPQRQALLRELEALSNEKIATELPNLSASQTALRSYIDSMHKTSAGQSDGGDIQ